MAANAVIRRAISVGGAVGAALAVREMVSRSREADLRGQVALVTGGSRGLGLALARELADQGCRLAICARDEAGLERAADDLRSRGAEVLAVPCDVADRDAVNRMVEQVQKHYGQIDVLVCNAGVIQVGAVRNTELEDYEQAMDIMYWGVLHPILAVLPDMRTRRSGRIGIVTSIGGKVSVPRLLPYNTAKFAAVGLGEGLHAELADEGISVSTFVPGLMRTGSYVAAEFSGDDEGRKSQYRLFAPISSLPGLTSSAESAAQTFIRALRRGTPEVIYPPQYALVARLHGVAPVSITRVMAIADRIVPAGGEGVTTVPGATIEPQVSSSWWNALTILGRRAGRRLGQRPLDEGSHGSD